MVDDSPGIRREVHSMSWRAHPTRFVSMPTVLPMSIPAGSLTDDTGMGVWRAQTVPVMRADGMYWARWAPISGRLKHLINYSAGPMPPALIDWSTTL